MPISESAVRVGSYYATPTDQLRKVTGIAKDDKGRDRITYQTKSIKLKKRAFGYGGGTKANPALKSTFAKACDRELSSAEVSRLRADGVLLAGE